MNKIVEQVKNDVESFLMEDMENQEMRVDFILYNPDNNNT
ncbi:unknown [Clostridium sp. CAG:571]|nr:unknown [Clostridium sp. CAG:571]